MPTFLRLVLVPLALALTATTARASFGSSSYAEEPEEPPENLPPVAELVVRPDVLAVTFSLRATEENVEKALAAARLASEELTRTVLSIAPGAVVRLKGFALTLPEGKADDGRLVALVEGSIELPLPATAAYWDRARAVAGLGHATRVASNVRDRKRLAVEFSPVRAFVKDPELHRAELTRRWAQRLHDFASRVRLGDQPLAPTDCTPPGDLAQRPISLEEVAITAVLSCALSNPNQR